MNKLTISLNLAIPLAAFLRTAVLVLCACAFLLVMFYVFALLFAGEVEGSR